MAFRIIGFNDPIFSGLQDMFGASDHEVEKSVNTPSTKYVRDAKAMASTPADIKEYPDSYVFVLDMPGLKSEEIKVQVEENNVLVVTGIRQRREDEKEKEVRYVRMERRIGKFMRQFVLPENANVGAISAACVDGVLTITVNKLPPPEPKKPRTIQVKIG